MHEQLRRALDEIEATVGPLDVETIRRPIEGRWSIAEILEHLTLAFRANARALEKALASGETRARPPRVAEWVGRIVVINFGYFPRAEAPERTRPAGGIPPQRSLDAIRDALTTLDIALARTAQRFGNKARVANHPYFAGLTVPQWRKFHMRHTVHHMRQVRACAVAS